MNSISFAGESDASGYTPDDNFRKGLLSCVKQKDAEGCFRLLDSLYAAYQSHPSGLISMVREDYYACLSQLFQHCLAHRIDFQSASSQQLWDVISSAHTLKELHAIAVNLYQSYFDLSEKTGKKLPYPEIYGGWWRKTTGILPWDCSS